MDDTWFESDVTIQDVHDFLGALSLRDNQRAPLLAVASDKAGVARLVAASHALFGLFGVTTPDALSQRLLRSADPGARRLAVLFKLLPLEGAPRLERLRFFLGPGSEIITFICRRLTMRGRPVFIAAALGIRAGLVTPFAPPSPPTIAPDIAAETAKAALSPTAEPDADPAPEPLVLHEVVPEPAAVTPRRDAAAIKAELRARWPTTRALRFLWRTDAEAVCTLITPPLADVTGAATGDLVGRNLLELAPLLDPTGRLAARLAARETWSGLDLAWPITDAAATVGVVAGAIPAFESDRHFAGFRGFGVIHLDRVADAPPSSLAAILAGPQSPAAPEVSPVAQVDVAHVDAAHIDATQVDATDVAAAHVDAVAEAPSAREAESLAPADNPANVVPFPLSGKPLSVEEQAAFQMIGEALRQHREPAAPPLSLILEVEGDEPAPEDRAAETPLPDSSRAVAPPSSPEASSPEASSANVSRPEVSLPEASATQACWSEPRDTSRLTAREREIGRNALNILDKLNLGLLVSRDSVPIFANRHLLDMLGFENEDKLHEAGGMTHLFGGLPGNVTGSEAVGIRGRDGSILAANARMQAIEWDGLPATLLTLKQLVNPTRVERELEAKRHLEGELRELRAILETATDGIAVVDAQCNVLSLNRSGEALFGRDRAEVIGKPFLALFAPHNQSLASDYFEGLKSSATRSLLNDGRELLIKAYQGGTIPVFMTLGRLGPAEEGPAVGGTRDGPRFCALFRDLTHWKKVEQELDHARQDAERTSALKSDFLAKVSHEIRTPLNAIIGFAEVIMDERFGPVGNERYKDYLKDIHGSGTHVMSLVTDLLDLSKIEAGKMELCPTALDVNKIIGDCVGEMQPRASQERVIMRQSLAPTLPRIKADERSLRQIVLNLLSNGVTFNEPGGQVIVATALTDAGQVVIRIRDTGPGMSDRDIEAALEPFRQLSTSRPMASGTGLGLPLTKALVEANNAALSIRSKVDQGTLVEVAFPPALVLAD